jgi:hypothetical protein
VIAASVIKVLDESMSAWRPKKNKTGGLPNISFILQKPEPLGTEFKFMAISETGIESLRDIYLIAFNLLLFFTFNLSKFIYSFPGIMLYLEIQRGKAEMPKWSARYRELGATASCTVRATIAMGNCGQRESEHHRNCILGDSWFSSVKMAEAIYECGHEWIGVVKTLYSLFPKKELEEKMKTWPG